MRKSTLFSLFSVLVLIPATVILGRQLPGRWFYFTGTLVIIEILLPFFFTFETRKPNPRELVVLSVMTAISVISRMLFPYLPNFKPTTAVIMLTGIAFGPEAGFLTGAVSAFVSNFFYGQGPWTPWQMLAFGSGGFLSGLLFRHRWQRLSPICLSVFGFASIMLLVGPLLDTSTVFTALPVLTWPGVAAVYGQGLVMNLSHAAACSLTLLFVGKPLLQKLHRFQTKYGIT